MLDQAAVRLSAALAEEFFGIRGARSPGPISIQRVISAFMLTSCMVRVVACLATLPAQPFSGTQVPTFVMVGGLLSNRNVHVFNF